MSSEDRKATIAVRVDPAVAERIAELAKREHRSREGFLRARLEAIVRSQSTEGQAA